MLRPNSIEQMIQVLTRFRDKYNRSYNIDKAHIEAVKEVAQKWQVTYANILDMCWRRLGLSNVSRFRNLLEKWILDDPKPLLELLKKFTPPYVHAEIEAVLVDNNFNVADSTAKTSPFSAKASQRLDETFSFSVDLDTAKKLKVLALMEGISSSDWLQKIMTEEIGKKYKTWFDSQRQ